MSFISARKKAGKKAIDAARLVNVSGSSVSQWEKGLCLPSADKLPVLAAFYGCTIEELLSDNPKSKE